MRFCVQSKRIRQFAFDVIHPAIVGDVHEEPVSSFSMTLFHTLPNSK